MADVRTVVTGISIALALACAGWAIYEVKHEAPAGAPRAQTRQPGAGGTSGGAPITVVTAVAKQRDINVGIEAIGTANSNEAVTITSRTSNIVTAIHFSDGETVKKGQVLVELDREQSAADLAAATAAFAESSSQFNRSRELLSMQVLSKAQYEQLEATMKANEARVAAAQARLSDTYIRAPFSGGVGMRRVSLGALISPGTVITTLDDTSSIKVDFAVPESHVGQLRVGQNVLAHTNAYPGRKFTGRVDSIDSRVDQNTRAVTVRALVANANAALKPGMFLTVELSQDRRPAVAIPEEAVVPEQARQFVYVIDGAVARKREVMLGRREPGFVEVTSGLAAGDHVVIEGTIKLRDGAPVKEARPTATAVADAPGS
ncbi:MAG: efflux RND transporter periplasmic adaptor subunit [Steroidobacteraceae bacterium]